MEKRSIKSIKQLPPWFNLKNYEAAKSFGADDWYDELMPRLHLRYCLENYGNKPDRIYVTEYWDSIVENGLLFHKMKDDDFKLRIQAITPHLHHLREISKKPRIGKLRLPGVTPLTNANMYGMCFWYSDDDEQKFIQKRINVSLNKEAETEALSKADAFEWLKKPFLNCPMDVRMELKNKYAYTKVDLTSSDEQLKFDFATWLENERNHRDRPAPKKNFSKADLEGWHESSVLPYLDLMFWSEIEHIKINQYVIAQAIFADAYSIDSEVDPLGKLKTTKKKADHLMKYETMKLLELQVG